MFADPFKFTGRIRRTEYGLSLVIYVILAKLLSLLGESTSLPIFWPGLVPLAWFILAQGAKRCHDQGYPGWVQLFPFYFLWLVFFDGQTGPNKYGDDPKART